MLPGALLQNAPDLAAAAGCLAGARVVVIGDAMLDRYYYGEVERISPEAPVPVLRIAREVTTPGGAGNVVRNLTALGAVVAFLSVLGDDQAGSDLTGLVGLQPGVEPWLLVQGGVTTTVKSRFIASGQQLLRVDQEAPVAIHPKIAERLLRLARDAMASHKVVVLSDYNKGLLTGDLAPELIGAARQAGCQVIVDPKGPDYSRYAGADIVTPNRRELAEATGMPTDSEPAIVAAAHALRESYRLGAVVVTRSEDGLTLLDGTGVHHYPAEAAEVYDVSGAGDTVIATLAGALAGGVEVGIAARLANIAAGIVVGKVGTAVVRDTDLLAAISPRGGALRKVVSWEEAAEQVERWR
ncbi:MAG: D-glycero-beta-D-manno-heptose-7-phosphate kinase, partial [Acetobacteraceae bacterium]|nr:D-glycero-beta-D-manno-heptose-7-phosphate kinase [Acetobacteraceae bacterium]